MQSLKITALPVTVLIQCSNFSCMYMYMYMYMYTKAYMYIPRLEKGLIDVNNK